MKIDCFNCTKIVEYKNKVLPEGWKIIGWLVSENQPYVMCPDCTIVHQGLADKHFENLRNENPKKKRIKIKLPAPPAPDILAAETPKILYREI